MIYNGLKYLKMLRKIIIKMIEATSTVYLVWKI